MAKRYLQNAREELKLAGIDRRTGIYADVKYVSSAAGKAYLTALEDLKALFLWEGLLSAKDLHRRLKKVDMYDYYLGQVMRIGKDRDVLKVLFNGVYKLLHLGAYYRELQSKKAIDDGFEKAEKMSRIVEKHIFRP